MKFFFVGIVLVLCFASVSAAEWTPSGDLSSVNSTAGIVEGAFNLEVSEPDARRVDFYIGDQQVASDRSAPFTLFENGASSLSGPYPKMVTARIFARKSPSWAAYQLRVSGTVPINLTNDTVVNGTNVSIINMTNNTNVSAPPVTNLSNSTSNLVNLLMNPSFLSGLTNWGYFTDYAYASWNPTGAYDAGAMHFVPNNGAMKSTESWQGRWRVHPGDKIIYSGWFKAGPLGTKKWNNGTGLGWDLRNAGGSTIFYTMNGPATINAGWTYINTEHIIPCVGHMDQPIERWSTSDGKSGTKMGARGGLWPVQSITDTYLGKPMPYDIDLVVWTHIWHLNTLQWADVDGLSLSVVPGVVVC